MSAQTSAVRPVFYQFDTKIIYVVQNMSKWCNSAGVAVWRRSENLSRTSGGCLAWIIRVRRRKRGKAGDPCHGPGAFVEPRDHAVDIDGGCRGHVLHVGLGYTPIPCASEAKGPPSLRERPFDAGPSLIELLAFLAGRPGLRCGQRLI